MKKLLSILLAMVLLLTCIPLGVLSVSAASGGFSYFVINGEATIYEYTSSGGAVTIPATLGGYPVTCIDVLAFYNSDITSVKMGKYVQYIEGGAFAECKKLTSVTLNQGLVYIGECAFQNTKIAEITIPKSVISIGNSAFYRCSKLKSITLPFIGEHADGSGNNSFGYIFHGDTYIGNSDWLPGALNVVLTGGKTIGRSFSGCTYLNSITIPDSVTAIEYGAFSGCEKLKKVTFGKKLKTINSEAFSGCTALTSITIPNSVTTIGYSAFYGCSALTSITIPDSVTTIESSAFSFCKKLKTITLGKNVKVLENYEDIMFGPQFAGCENLTAIKVSSQNPYFSSVDGVLFNKKKTVLKICPPGKTGAYTVPKGTTKIESLAFYTCNKLTSIAISDSVKTVEYCAISRCENLKKLTLGKGVKTFSAEDSYYSHPFADCPKLTSLTVSKSNPYFSSENNVLFNKKKTTLVLCAPGKTGSYVIPNSVTTVQGDALSDYLSAVVVPTSVKTFESYYIATESRRIFYTGTRSQANKINFKGDTFGWIVSEEAKQEDLAMWHYNTCKTHKYTNACDKTCNKCDWVRTIKHTYKVVGTKKATTTANGKGKNVCSVCGYTSSKTTIIYKASAIKLSKTIYTYNGKVQKPTVTVKDSNGKTIAKSNYTVTYASGRKNVGTYKVTVKFKGNYSGTKTLTFKINPAKTTVKSLTAGKKSLKVAITKKSTQVTGYEVQYSTSKSFKTYKTKTLSGYKKTSTTLSGLKAKKTYYVRVRTYKTVNGVKYYSGWSTIKYKKTK